MVGVSCILCDREADTRKEDVYVTVSWVLRDILEKEDRNYEEELPRVCRLCKECWESLKNKPEDESSYWMFDKTV